MWDLFISHASEDKECVARPLAESLASRGLSVWYDEYTLRIGDNLREKLDNGLQQSRYGVVILSQSFFEKKWPLNELEGLFSLDQTHDSRILPVWHEVSASDVTRFSPMLAARVAVLTGSGIKHVASEICKKVCCYLVRDHYGRTHEIDVSRCENHGDPATPNWLQNSPLRMSSEWLVNRLANSASLRLYFDPTWCDGTWMVLDQKQSDGEVIYLDQLGDLRPASPTTTTTTTQPPQLFYQINKVPRD